MRIQLEYSESLHESLGGLESRIATGQDKVGSFFEDITAKIDSIERLQNVITTNSLSMNGLVFYSCYLCAIWFLTSFKSLRDSRFKLLGMCALSLGAEKFNLLDYPHLSEISEWHIAPKYLLVGATALTLLYQRVSYRDYHRENNRLLRHVLANTTAPQDKTPAWFRKYKPITSFQAPLLQANHSYSRELSPKRLFPDGTLCVREHYQCQEHSLHPR